MMLSRAALRSVSGWPVTDSLVLRGSIGQAVALHSPLPFAGMSLVPYEGLCNQTSWSHLCARLQTVAQEVWELYF